MDPKLNVAIEAARKAGQIIAHGIDRLDKVKISTKGDNDYVTSIDKQAEKAIITALQAVYPTHHFLGEENGHVMAEKPEDNQPQYTWIIDPLDGTTNFIHGIPHVSVSIALQENNKLILGVVYDPLRNELFTAYRGKGAQLNGTRIRVAQQSQLNHALLGSDFPCYEKTLFEPFAKSFADLFKRCGDIRTQGGTALSLAYVASGRLDGFWEMRLNPWDIAAGMLLVKEAGGLIGDFQGGEKSLENGDIVAANPKLFKQILSVIKPHLG